MDGPRNMASNVSAHITADLSSWIHDDDVLIRWIINPDMADGLSGVLVPMEPDHWGRHSEEWVFHLIFPPNDESAFDDNVVLQRMRKVLGIPDFNPKVHLISRWSLEGIVADRLRVGNVFLLGDAAHRHPPTGVLGLNTSVHDAYNLCWKVAAVLPDQINYSRRINLVGRILRYPRTDECMKSLFLSLPARLRVRLISSVEDVPACASVRAVRTAIGS